MDLWMDLFAGFAPTYTEMASERVDWSWDSVDDHIRKLSVDTTELGIAAEETFKNAVAALYTSGFQAVTVVDVTVGASDAHIRAAISEILRHPALSGDAFLRIAEIQSIASAFVHIAEHSREIAGRARALQGAAEQELARIAPDVDDLLRQLIHQAFILIRGSVMLSSRRDDEMAERLLAAAGDLDRLYLDFRRADLAAISAHTERALLLQHVLLAGSRLQEIGNSARAVCKAVRRTPAPPPPTPGN